MYFLETPCNEWNIKKAFVRYLEDKNFTEVKDCMKKDLLVMKNSQNFGKKLKGKVEEYLELLGKHHPQIQDPDNDAKGATTDTSNTQTNNYDFRKVEGNVNISNYNSKRGSEGSPSNANEVVPKKQRMNDFTSRSHTTVSDPLSPQNSTCLESSNTKILQNEKEIDELFNPQNSTAPTNGFKLPNIPTRIEDLDPSDFIAEVENPYILSEKNLSSLLYQYQKAIAMKNNTEGLLVELNTHELLAVNNVLLIKPGQHSKMMLNFFSEEVLLDIERDLVAKFKIEDKDFDKHIKDQIDDILKELKKGRITCKQAAKRVYNLTSDDTTFNSTDSIITSLHNLIQKIPKKKFNGQIRENAISCSYADAILTPMFTIPDANKHLLWLNTKVLEESSKQPDFACQELVGSNWTGPTIVGEVKGEGQKDDKYVCLLDLIRIGSISVDSINLNLYDAVIGIHIVALQVTFYVTTLVADGFYVMMEICSIPLPRDVTELRSYVTNFDELLTVLQYSGKCKVSSNKEKLQNMTVLGINTPEFDRFIASSRDRRRECPIVYHH